MGRLRIGKMSVLPKLTYKYNIITIKILVFFPEINKLFKKFIWKCKRPSIVKIVLKKNKADGLTLQISRLIKIYSNTSWSWHRIDKINSGMK